MTGRAVDELRGPLRDEQGMSVESGQPHSPMMGMLFLVLFIVFSERYQMDHGMNYMMGMADRMKSWADTLTSTVQGLQTAAAAPRALRQLQKGSNN